MSFLQFFKEEFLPQNYPNLLRESIDGRINQLADTAIFGKLGEDFIRTKFSQYEEQGVIPNALIASKATKSAGSNTQERIAAGIQTREPKEAEKEQMLDYTFRFIDRDVQEAIRKLESYNTDAKFKKKVDKHYQGLTTKPAIEDASEISNVFLDYFFFKGKKGFGEGLPKSLREKLDYADFSKAVRSANDKFNTGGGEERNSSQKTVIPEGFRLLKQKGNLEYYIWEKQGVVCDLDFDEKSKFISIERDRAGGVTENWCIAQASYRDQYGQPDSDGVFAKPFYLLRKDNAPYILFHGESLQAKQGAQGEPPITEEQADEIMSTILTQEDIMEILKDHL